MQEVVGRLDECINISTTRHVLLASNLALSSDCSNALPDVEKTNWDSYYRLTPWWHWRVIVDQSTITNARLGVSMRHFKDMMSHLRTSLLEVSRTTHQAWRKDGSSHRGGSRSFRSTLRHALRLFCRFNTERRASFSQDGSRVLSSRCDILR